ncbi:hypothetical protein ETAA8_48060 [Anatilimnocola aggregata]|uniref:DUF4190 domain-containing protein n=1 Tax=Anatilimnocola aggregata TaxID=2528021 RepID=A0A517YHJ5_9BACT|nr:hypothetical protein [Anatilimnocola aggregata]QDU29691.1 hypothetical protein ETAA8_48060 [Anatilimnocola aggregata]
MERSSPANTMMDQNHGEPELPQYRAISPWAVATLIAGLAAPLALIGPLLWWVPLIAIPLALLAFRQLRTGDPPYIGKNAAVCGICLAALFAGWAVAQRLSREVRSTSEAQRFVDDWLELLRQGKMHEAHQVATTAGRRTAIGTDLESFYKVQLEAGKEFEAFQRSPIIAAIAKNSDLELAFAEITTHAVQGNTDYFTLRYEVVRGHVPSTNGSIWISAKREIPPGSTLAEWQINSYSATEVTE